MCGHHHCPDVVMVAKTDDNVELELEMMMTGVRNMENQANRNKVICGTGMVTKNLPVIRNKKSHMMGNWTVSKEEIDDEVFDDFCFGFLYLTTPEVGANLVQAAALAFSGEDDIEQIEDSLITGKLRTMIEVPIYGSFSWLSSSSSESSSLISTSLLETVLSQCYWLQYTQNTFFNHLVKSKVSSRKQVPYVGSVWNTQLWRTYLCVHLEMILEYVEAVAPNSVPHFIFNICER